MEGSSNDRRFAVQEHPAGRIELTRNIPYTEEYLRRSFSEGDISEVFHENTKFDRKYLNRSKLTNETLPEHLAAVEHDYHGAPSVVLPEPQELEYDLETVLANRRSVRTFSDRGVTQNLLGTILGHAVGPTARQRAGGPVETFRPYPSAGGLLPVEVYPVVVDGEDINDGLYYYAARDHELRVLDNGGEEIADVFCNTFMDAAFARDIVADAGVTFVMTGCFGRCKIKYGPVGYRFTLLEAGHIAQNLLLVAEALDLAGVPLGSFLDDTIDEFLDIDGVNESTIYAVTVGHRKNDE